MRISKIKDECCFCGCHGLKHTCKLCNENCKIYTIDESDNETPDFKSAIVISIPVITGVLLAVLLILTH